MRLFFMCVYRIKYRKRQSGFMRRLIFFSILVHFNVFQTRASYFARKNRCDGVRGTISERVFLVTKVIFT